MSKWCWFFAAAAAALAAGHSAAESAWWSHVEFLADDKLEGRKAGTSGYKQAAAYVTEQFRAAGLKPGGTQGFGQPVTFQRRQIDESKSFIEVLTGDSVDRLVLGEDANLGTRGESDRVVEAQAVFVGHGLQIPEAGVNDLAGIDLKGKIAVYLSAAPTRVSASLAAHSQSLAERWKTLRAAGAVGIAAFANPKKSDIPWARSTLARTNPSLTLADQALVDTVGMQVQIVLNTARADRLLAGTGHTVEELLALDDSGKSLPAFPLKIRIRAKSHFDERTVTSDNVIGVLPGADAKLRSEYMVLSAHLDHLGIGKPINGDGVYNGAMDNASGVATLIEVAKALAAKRLNRSIAFAALTAEEGGLLGSRYFADRPSLANGAIVANINLDMFLPIIPLKAITVQGLDESDLGPEFARIAKRFGVEAKPDPEPERNGFIRSDQYSFIRRGVPALSFKFFAEPGSPEHRVIMDWRTKRYHAPSDDLQQPVNIEGAVKFTEILAAMAEDVATRAGRPTWNEKSFFRRFAR